MKTLSLFVDSVVVHQKEQLYCLNDLHKAADRLWSKQALIDPTIMLFASRGGV